MNKVWAFTKPDHKDGKFVKIGEVNETADWYKITDAIGSFIDTIKRGDSVDFKFEKSSDGRNILTFIKKVGSSNPVDLVSKTSSTYTPNTNLIDAADSIRRQVAVKAVATTLVSMQGTIDPNNMALLEDVIDRLFNKYYNLINGK